MPDRPVPDRPVPDRAVPDRPEIVCLCGSARARDELVAVAFDLALSGAVVLAPALPPPATGRPAGDGLTNGQRAALGALHLRKVDLADRVVVVNPGGHLGESVSREVAHARAAGIPVTFTHPA